MRPGAEGASAAWPAGTVKRVSGPACATTGDGAGAVVGEGDGPALPAGTDVALGVWSPPAEATGVTGGA
ncbi:hypothetical protein D3C72_695670 [compost metagenome]